MDISALSNAYYTIWKLRLEGAMAYTGQVAKEDYLPTSYMELVTGQKQIITRQMRHVEMTTDIVRAFQKLAVEMRCQFPYIKSLTPTDLLTVRFVGTGLKERTKWNTAVTAKIDSHEVKKLFIETMNKELRNVF